MSKKGLVKYIKEQLQKGYDVSSIKDISIKYGYSSKEIDDAIKEAYSPTIKHEIHLSKTTVFVVVLILATITGVAYFLYSPSKTPANLLDVSLESVKSDAAPGGDFTFIQNLKNLGSSKRYDVQVKLELIDSKSFKIVTTKIDTIALETSSSTQSKVNIPVDTPPGDYILRAIVEYDGKKAVATLPVKILGAPKESCSDGIKNQDEENVDCGGVCGPCKTEQGLDCDDNNPCTQDTVENDKCINKKISPCCGDGICDAGESCSSDCNDDSNQQQNAEGPSIDEIKETAKSDSKKAQEQCNLIRVPDLKDTCISNIGEVQQNKDYCAQVQNSRIKDICYSNLAKILKDNTLCDDVSADGRRDSCFMTFVTDYKDYSVCTKLTNSALTQSCDYLRQLSDLNQQTASQQTNISG